jgi:hypothetical protein
MKFVRAKIAFCSVLLTCAWSGLTQPALSASPTALELAKEGNRYVGEQAKDKVVQIRSEKSIAGTTPTIWFVVYYDSTATFKAVEVKFGGGKMLEVKRPFRLLEPVTGSDQPLDLNKVKLDSDQAIATALKEPILDKLTITATSAKLERGEGGLPVWKIRVWAAKLRNPKDQADLGEIVLSAEDGSVLKNSLHINRVD